MNSKQAILDLIDIVAAKLGEKLDNFVFVGGAAAALLINDPAAGDVRPTDDIDLVVQIETYKEYQILIESLRKSHGFKHIINGPLCRFSVEGVTVDVMPTEESVLKFCNKWYKTVVAQANEITLASGITIRLVSAPLFLCTKLEAFADRGKNDYFGSSDLEDIISLIDGRPELIAECQAAPQEVQEYLSASFSKLLSIQEFVDSIEGLLPFGSERSLKTVTTKLETLAKRR